MTILSRTEQTGRSMVEMLGVLAIIGVLSVGGISGYSKAMAKYKLTKAQDQITMLLMNIRTAYATSPSYSGLTAETAADFNIAPGEMITGSGTNTSLNGAFGGPVQLGTVTSSATYFYIGMESLGREACRSLLSSDWGADGLVQITAGPTATITAPTTASCTSAVPSADGVGTWCTSDLPASLQEAAFACSGEQNHIVWMYY